jgi:hypothetical protein
MFTAARARDIITEQRAPRIAVQAIRERLGRLTSDQLEAGMVFLSGYDPALFDVVIYARRHGTTGDHSGAADISVPCLARIRQ